MARSWVGVTFVTLLLAEHAVVRHVPTNEGNVLAVAARLPGDLDAGYVASLLLMFSFGAAVAGIVVTGLFGQTCGCVSPLETSSALCRQPMPSATFQALRNASSQSGKPISVSQIRTGSPELLPPRNRRS